jgi:hypothetical protein
MKKSELKSLIREVLTEDDYGYEDARKEAGKSEFKHEEYPIPLKTAILSHLSDLQERMDNPKEIMFINFVKAMVLKLTDGTKEMSTDELDQLFYKYMKGK